MHTPDCEKTWARCVACCLLLIALTLAPTIAVAERLVRPGPIPDDFPRFQVPGNAEPMALLRELYWDHYWTSRPRPTMWDEWLPEAALWPRVEDGHTSTSGMRAGWSRALTNRIINPDGYVATHQHRSIAHQQGWPFPYWTASPNTYGWHFSFKNTAGRNWIPDFTADERGWTLDGATSHGIVADGWHLELTTAGAWAIADPRVHEKTISTFEAPYMQVRWKSEDMAGAHPYLEWATQEEPEFSEERRMYLPPPDATEDKITVTMVPMFRHPKWVGTVERLRLNFGNGAPGHVWLQGLWTQYDTRHNVNNQSFVDGSIEYFYWTRDLNFLRQNLDRMRAAVRFIIEDGKLRTEKVHVTDWPGHDGRTGVVYKDGEVDTRHGHGVASNYWDLLPFGARDCYATLRSYAALLNFAALEDAIAAHPEWNMPDLPGKDDAPALRKLAAQLKIAGNREFWNPETGRFVACIDADGKPHDYGFTFVNLEAIYYGFASPDHARSILDWVGGKRIVEDDTSTGTDIYHWRFAPRTTTLRNLDWYSWVWNFPQKIPWGDQVQDGGAVLGWSYHDLMARLAVNGADDAARRLAEILAWYGEVKAAGGYRAYYAIHDGKMQGGGKEGGLGMDYEFFESVLVPQVMLRGFMGFRPNADGFSIDPKLPADWPELRITRIALHDQTLAVRATTSTITVEREGGSGKGGRCRIGLPRGDWQGELSGGSAPAQRLQAEPEAQPQPSAASIQFEWGDYRKLVLTRED